MVWSRRENTVDDSEFGELFAPNSWVIDDYDSQHHCDSYEYGSSGSQDGKSIQSVHPVIPGNDTLYIF